MKKVWMVATLASFFAAGAMAESWTGTISDEKCAAKHEAASALAASSKISRAALYQNEC